VLSNNSPGIVLVDVRTGPPLGGRTGFERVVRQVQATGRLSFNTVAGIGDGAFATGKPDGGPDGGPIATTVFYVGATTVTMGVSLQRAGRPSPSDQARTLAAEAAGRL
jgi:hypothetical protein